MTTIYVVTSGEYSDYRLDGLFSTLEKAKRFITDNPRQRVGGYEVEEWQLDEYQYHTTKTVWGCEMDLETGSIKKEWSYSLSCEGSHTNIFDYPNSAIAVHSSISQEHARKLAVEERQKRLRTMAMRGYGIE